MDFKAQFYNMVKQYCKLIPYYVTPGWWLTYPSEKYEFVSWDDEIPN